jgi:RNA polymerase sigma factor (sigma-70 family)
VGAPLLTTDPDPDELDPAISATVEREGPRLRRFLRRRVPAWLDVEDVLQDAFLELVVASRLADPIERAGAWLFRVARNRVIDLLRRKRTAGLAEVSGLPRDAEESRIEDLLPSPEAGPEVAYVRGLLFEELADALEELPPDQREVFLAHEVRGESFREISRRTGINVNTLLSRKRNAVLYLRGRLREIYDDFRKGETP